MHRRSREDQPIVGIWSTDPAQDARAATAAQVSRLGMPLVNEVVIPLKDKDKFNASRRGTTAQFLEYVTNPELPKLIEAIYKIKAPGGAAQRPGVGVPHRRRRASTSRRT